MANDADVEEPLGKTKKMKMKRDKSRGRAAKTDESPLSPEDPNDKSATKVIFDKYLNSYYGNEKQSDKKKKKAMESLKKGDYVRKDKQDEKTLLANLYDPEHTKTGKSNKRRETERGKDKHTGKSNEAFIDETGSKSAKEKRNKSPEIIKNLSRKNKKQMPFPGLVKKQSNEREQSHIREEASPRQPKTKGKQLGHGDQESELLSEDEETRKKKKKTLPVFSSDNEPPGQDGEVGVVRRKKKPKTKPPVSEKETWTGEDEDSEPTVRRKKKSKTKPPVSDKETWTGEDEDVEPGVRRKKKKKIRVPGSDKETWTGEEDGLDTGVRRKKKKKIRTPGDDEATCTWEDEELEPGVRKQKKKKIRTPGDDEATCTWEDEELEPGMRKKRKKKVRPPGTDKETVTEGEPEEAEDDTKGKKRKKKKKKPELTDRDTAMSDSGDSPEIPDSGEVFAVTIHRTDKLKTDFIISHPVVRVHIVNEDTGTLLKKQHKNRPVTSFYEQDGNNVDIILPIMTQPFDFKQNMSTLPIWEELLVFNENYNYFIQKNPKVIVFFEIMDFVSMHRASERWNASSGGGGWHRIAWAFLKVVSDTDAQNTGHRLRLQLFEAPTRYHSRADTVDVYQWWKRCRLNKYPATLYVTVKGIIPPKEIEPAARSMFATQGERGTVEFNQLSQKLDEASRHRSSLAQVEPSQWTRLSGQLCRVPNCLALNLPAGGGGCFVIRFSHDGKTLACGCHDKDGFPITLYEIPSGEVKGQLQGHFGMTYDLCWSKKDKQLVSASADATVRVWNVAKPSALSSKVLPHPTYVYAAKFHPRVTRVIVTGCYDHILRIWSIQGDSSSGELLQELDQHHSFINAVCFDSDGKRLFSADSVGVIYMWNVYVTELPSSKGLLRDWTLNKQLKDKDLEGVAVSSLEVHPNNNRLLAHSRDNVIRMFDLRIGGSGMTMQKFFGGLNFRELIHSTFTPCGSFVFAGSEDSCAYVWNTETGDQVAVYTDLGYRSPVSDVQFHPLDHIVAFCAFGDNQPVLVYKFDHEVAQKDVGMESGERARSPELKASAIKSDNEELETARSRVSTARDMFKAEETAKMERVMSLLHSVRPQSTSNTLLASQHPLAVPYGSSGTLLSQSTWGSTFDTTMFTKSASRILDPSAMSPHSVSDTRSLMMQQQQQLAAQAHYMEYNQAGDRPGFLPVGRQGMHSLSTPQISMTATPGKPQFSFQSLKSAKEEELEKVVALYDYKAQRSDEISLRNGDLVLVLYKDSANWWMGQLPNGQQGFFPSNYVTECDKDVAKSSENVEHIVDIHASDDYDDKPSRHVAVVTKSGELKIFSAPEDSDPETPIRSCSRPKKKKGKRREPTVMMMDEVLPSPIVRGKTKQRRSRETNDSEV